MTTIGNHEVNYGMDYIRQIVKANSSMGMVCANIRNAKTGDLEFDPYKIIEETVVDSNGQERKLKIGVTGVVPTQILNWDKFIEYIWVSLANFSPRWLPSLFKEVL